MRTAPRFRRAVDRVCAASLARAASFFLICAALTEDEVSHEDAGCERDKREVGGDDDDPAHLVAAVGEDWVGRREGEPDQHERDCDN
eukprot:3677102-Pleurochrysis_carterae.AAC.1